MAEIAIHLVDNIIPIVPTRQYVLSLPYPLRLGISYNQELLAKICSLACEEISKFIIDKTGVNKEYAIPGMGLFVRPSTRSVRQSPLGGRGLGVA